MAIRIYQLGKELGMDNQELIALLKMRGHEVNCASSTVDDMCADSLREEFSGKNACSPSHSWLLSENHQDTEEAGINSCPQEAGFDSDFEKTVARFNKVPIWFKSPDGDCWGDEQVRMLEKIHRYKIERLPQVKTLMAIQIKEGERGWSYERLFSQLLRVEDQSPRSVMIQDRLVLSRLRNLMELLNAIRSIFPDLRKVVLSIPYQEHDKQFGLSWVFRRIEALLVIMEEQDLNHELSFCIQPYERALHGEKVIHFINNWKIQFPSGIAFHELNHQTASWVPAARPCRASQVIFESGSSSFPLGTFGSVPPLPKLN